MFRLYAIVLIAATLLIYQPAWRGGFLWDDDAHVTKPELRSPAGLGRIWTKLGATQQYYPLLHSAFWVQHRLWGDATLGYHLVNIALHAIAAVMFALVLRRLEIPGAYLAAAIFALHPVHVESVAWITELKNTLSGVFYLGAALAYLRFDKTRQKGMYALAAALFLLGLLSKTVTATLPAALLVVFWWKRGRLSWKRDVLPLVPLFVLGAAMGLLTAWVERKLIGAEGGEFSFTAVERCLIAGRVLWFYLGKLFRPAQLTFIYKRWDVSQAVWWQYLFPIAAALLTGGLWALRRWSRAPLAATLFFAGTLFPVLGFFNVYPFRFSFVADHFQYLPSLGVISLSAAGLMTLLKRFKPWGPPAALGIAAAILVSLAILTWRQSRMYSDAEGLYRQTLARSPECWMAHNNLGAILEKRDPDEARACYRRALSFKPDYAEAHFNLARALMNQGELAAAVKHYQQVVRLEPYHYRAHNNLAGALMAQKKPEAAIEHYRRALQIKPDQFEVHWNLASALEANGEVGGAVRHYEQALRLKPDSVPALNNLAWLLATEPSLAGRDPAEAVTLAEKACELTHRAQAICLDTLAAAHAAAGRFGEAIATAQEAIDLANASGQAKLAGVIQRHLDLYRAGKSCRGQLPSSQPAGG